MLLGDDSLRLQSQEACFCVDCDICLRQQASERERRYRLQVPKDARGLLVWKSIRIKAVDSRRLTSYNLNVLSILLEPNGCPLCMFKKKYKRRREESVPSWKS